MIIAEYSYFTRNSVPLTTVIYRKIYCDEISNNDNNDNISTFVQRITFKKFISRDT